MVHILVVDDDEDTLEVVRVALTKPGRKVEAVRDAQAALAMAGTHQYAVVLTDINLKSKVNGLDLLRAFREASPATNVILMSGFGTLDNAVEGVRNGAFDYISKPFDIREVIATVDRACEARTPVETVSLASSPLPAGLLGRTRGMLEVYKQIALAADSSTPILVIGESGTGKELVARAIHDYGKGAARPFVAVNCGALAETLLESELFGHVRGSFTGAVADKKGLFEQANGGTIFLDEIGETSPALQVKLLRVLQEGEVRPVGASRSAKVNARVLAATNRDLEEEVAARRFRQDLYYRLSAFIIRLPALRDRRDDIPLLLGQFVRNAGARARRDVQLTPDAVERGRAPGDRFAERTGRPRRCRGGRAHGRQREVRGRVCRTAVTGRARAALPVACARRRAWPSHARGRDPEDRSQDALSHGRPLRHSPWQEPRCRRRPAASGLTGSQQRLDLGGE